MKILCIHADYIKYKPAKKAIEQAEELSHKGETTVKECLVVLTSVEKEDEKNPKKIAEKLVEEIKKVASQVKAKNIVLYPYAHLSSSLASPDIAIKVLNDAESLLKKSLEVTRAPFGYYKEFELKAKGHPLSELSRIITLEEKEQAQQQEETDAVKNEKKLKSTWFILDTDGKLNPITMKNGKPQGFTFAKYKKLETFISYEMEKVRVAKEEPPHVALMKKMELVDYEPGSDPGNLRFYPKGKLMKSLIEQYVTDKVIDYGAIEVETPIMYDYEHPSLKSYLNRFPARQYTIQTPNKRTFLRFSACFGQFLIAHDMTISYKDLPLKIYELAKSFRVEQRGELTGLRRLRAFTMPDCHCLCQDLEQGKQEMQVRFDLAQSTLQGVGFSLHDDFELAIRVTKEFYNKNKDFVNLMVKKWGKPAVIEMWEDRFFYFILKYELNYVDSLDKASALSTDQIDVENGERYNINFINKEGKKEHPLILHLSPSGAVERVLYALLEKKAAEAKEGKNPSFPLWLSPIQARIIPVVVEKHFKDADKLKTTLEENNIRVDLDDTNDTLSKKIRKAEMEWIPYIIVLGDKEVKEKAVTVRDRNNKQEILSQDAFIKKVKTEVGKMPAKALPLPRYLSKRPIFVG